MAAGCSTVDCFQGVTSIDRTGENGVIDTANAANRTTIPVRRTRSWSRIRWRWTQPASSSGSGPRTSRAWALSFSLTVWNGCIYMDRIARGGALHLPAFIFNCWATRHSSDNRDAGADGTVWMRAGGFWADRRFYPSPAFSSSLDCAPRGTMSEPGNAAGRRWQSRLRVLPAESLF